MFEKMYQKGISFDIRLDIQRNKEYYVYKCCPILWKIVPILRKESNFVSFPEKEMRLQPKIRHHR